MKKFMIFACMGLLGFQTVLPMLTIQFSDHKEDDPKTIEYDQKGIDDLKKLGFETINTLDNGSLDGLGDNEQPIELYGITKSTFESIIELAKVNTAGFDSKLKDYAGNNDALKELIKAANFLENQELLEKCFNNHSKRIISTEFKNKEAFINAIDLDEANLNQKLAQKYLYKYHIDKTLLSCNQQSNTTNDSENPRLNHKRGFQISKDGSFGTIIKNTKNDSKIMLNALGITWSPNGKYFVAYYLNKLELYQTNNFTLEGSTETCATRILYLSNNKTALGRILINTRTLFKIDFSLEQPMRQDIKPQDPRWPKANSWFRSLEATISEDGRYVVFYNPRYCKIQIVDLKNNSLLYSGQFKRYCDRYDARLAISDEDGVLHFSNFRNEADILGECCESVSSDWPNILTIEKRGNFIAFACPQFACECANSNNAKVWSLFIYHPKSNTQKLFKCSGTGRLEIKAIGPDHLLLADEECISICDARNGTMTKRKNNLNSPDFECERISLNLNAGILTVTGYNKEKKIQSKVDLLNTTTPFDQIADLIFPDNPEGQDEASEQLEEITENVADYIVPEPERKPEPTLANKFGTIWQNHKKKIIATTAIGSIALGYAIKKLCFTS